MAFWLLYNIIIVYTKWAGHKLKMLFNILKVLLQIAFIIEHFVNSGDTYTMQLLVLKKEYYAMKNEIRGVIFALLMTVSWLSMINVFRLWGPFRVFVDVF